LLPDRTHFQQFTLSQPLTAGEAALLIHLEQYPSMTAAAAAEYNPSVLCNYAFSLAQSFNSFYDDHPIAKAENDEKKCLRLMIIILTAQVLRHSMHLLGIKLPEKM
jgi:arginyl-tRNA synthetase